MNGKRCPVCGVGILKIRRETRQYGRDINVVLENVPVRSCPACGEQFVMIPNIEGLHRAIALSVAGQRRRLTAGEIRFLRTFLGFSGVDFATFLGVKPETVSRWESRRNPQRMETPTEVFLRFLVQQGKRIDSYEPEGAALSERHPVKPLRFNANSANWATA